VDKNQSNIPQLGRFKMVQRTYGYEQRECAHNIKWVHLRIRVYWVHGDSGEHHIICVENVRRRGQKENKFQFSLKILHIKFVTLN